MKGKEEGGVGGEGKIPLALRCFIVSIWATTVRHKMACCFDLSSSVASCSSPELLLRFARDAVLLLHNISVPAHPPSRTSQTMSISCFHVVSHLACPLTLPRGQMAISVTKVAWIKAAGVQRWRCTWFDPSFCYHLFSDYHFKTLSVAGRPCFSFVKAQI